MQDPTTREPKNFRSSASGESEFEFTERRVLHERQHCTNEEGHKTRISWEVEVFVTVV